MRFVQLYLDELRIKVLNCLVMDSFEIVCYFIILFKPILTLKLCVNYMGSVCVCVACVRAYARVYVTDIYLTHHK